MANADTMPAMPAELDSLLETVFGSKQEEFDFYRGIDGDSELGDTLTFSTDKLNEYRKTHGIKQWLEKMKDIGEASLTSLRESIKQSMSDAIKDDTSAEGADADVQTVVEKRQQYLSENYEIDDVFWTGNDDGKRLITYMLATNSGDRFESPKVDYVTKQEYDTFDANMLGSHYLVVYKLIQDDNSNPNTAKLQFTWKRTPLISYDEQHKLLSIASMKDYKALQHEKTWKHALYTGSIGNSNTFFWPPNQHMDIYTFEVQDDERTTSFARLRPKGSSQQIRDRKAILSLSGKYKNVWLKNKSQILKNYPDNDGTFLYGLFHNKLQTDDLFLYEDGTYEWVEKKDVHSDSEDESLEHLSMFQVPLKF